MDCIRLAQDNGKLQDILDPLLSPADSIGDSECLYQLRNSFLLTTSFTPRREFNYID